MQLTDVPPSPSEVLAKVHRRKWFYEFELPDGSRTRSYLPSGVERIHSTRLEMLWSALAGMSDEDWRRSTAVDIACHQGFYAIQLARRGCERVLAIDARAQHVDDARLMAQAYALANLRVLQSDVDALDTASLGRFDVVLMFGLLYHLENPVGALRKARALTRRVCLVETQVTPNMTGLVDWGAHTFQRPMIGSFAVIDETDEVHAPETGSSGICLCPSHEVLVWMLHKVGFARVVRIPPPPGAYEQLASGKRVLLAAYV